MITAELHRNVQFIYERALAILELEAFGARDLSDKPQEPWIFHFNSLQDFDDVVQYSAYYATIARRATVYGELIKPVQFGGQYNVTRSINQYLTHWIYPYKGKFHPQMIRAIFNILHLSPGAVVLDLFSGSGTTCLEATVFGIDSIGIDTSPLCVLQARVKTQAWEKWQEIEARAQKILDLTTWADMEDALLQSRGPQVIKDFFLLSRMVVLSDVEVRKRTPENSLRRNLPKMTASVKAMARAKERLKLDFGASLLCRGDARDLASSGVEEESVDAIVTSPPYSIALDYVKNDAHALSALGESLDEIRADFIGVRGRARDRLRLYEDDMRIAFREMARVLKPGACAVVVIGNATVGEELRTTEDMLSWATDVGLQHTMTAPKIVYGLYNVMQDEKILFFRKG